MEWTAAAVGQGLIASPQGDIEDGDRDLFLENLRHGVSEAVARSVPLIIDLAAVGHMSASALMALTIARKDAVAGGIKIILARPGAALR
ncbi:MAG: STAS domain-containing protein, partial [Alphaproteobacteria bacterium]